MLGLDVYFLTIFITFFLSIFVFLILWISFSTNKSKMLKSNMVLNATCQKKLKENNFNITKTITLNDYFTIGADNIEKQKVFIDEENRKICFINYETHKYYILNFNELINYEVYSNDTSLSVGGHGGGLFAGLFAASSEKRIKELKLIIRINQIQNSQIVIPVIFKTFCNFGLSNNDDKFVQIMESLQQFCSVLEVIKNS